MRVETPFKTKQRSSERKVITEELEDLQNDMAELNQVMSTIERCIVVPDFHSEFCVLLLVGLDLGFREQYNMVNWRVRIRE